MAIRSLAGLLAFVAVSPAPAQILRLSEPNEIEVGRRIAMEIEFDQPMFSDEEVVRYIERIGLRLARESGRSHLRYRFRILQSDDVNAFVLPGGFVYLTRGLIEAAGSEAELAGVIAHEIGHVVARHHASKIRRSQLASLGFSAVGPGIVGGGLSAMATRQGGRVAARGIFQRFSREDEREADRIGAKNMYDAGYDPRGMVSFFERIAGMRIEQPGAVARFFASHPSPEERAENIGDLIESFPPKAGLIGRTREFDKIRQRTIDLRPATGGSTSETALAILLAADEDPESAEARRDEIAATFAPLFYQALGDQPRYDYIVNFDFDGDWRGDNNWDNAANKDLPFEAWVYYRLSETPTHYFLHYAVFHPRDYKGGGRFGRHLSKALRAGASAIGSNDPTGRAQELVLAHENDLEGCLVVVEKRGEDPRDGQVVFVETLAHNKFYKYVNKELASPGDETVEVSKGRAKLYIEPKGHGVTAYTGGQEQIQQARNGFRLYAFMGFAESQRPDNKKSTVSYDLVPLTETLWPRAWGGLNETYGETQDYGAVLVDIVGDGGAIVERAVELGRLGSAFRGKVGGANLARPPWGWFDGGNPQEPLGHWYFDPARTVRGHFELGAGFSVAYTYLEIDSPPTNGGVEAFDLVPASEP